MEETGFLLFDCTDMQILVFQLSVEQLRGWRKRFACSGSGNRGNMHMETLSSKWYVIDHVQCEEKRVQLLYIDAILVLYRVNYNLPYLFRLHKCKVLGV